VICAMDLSANPLLGPSPKVLLDMGARQGELIIEDGEVWRLVAPMYLHGGLVHCAINMMVFIQVGQQLERQHGAWRVGAVYVLSGIFGNMVGATFAPDAISVGASGAVFGLFGALLGEIVQNWNVYKRPRSTLFWLSVQVALQLLIGTMPTLDNFAHFFGFCMGLACSLALLIVRRQNGSGERLAMKFNQRLIQGLATACVMAAFIVAFGALYGAGEYNPREICPWCERISCTPFPWGCDSSTPGACWWDCSGAGRCVGNVSYVGSAENGTVALECMTSSGDAAEVVVWPTDVSILMASGISSRAHLSVLCRDHCPRN